MCLGPAMKIKGGQILDASSGVTILSPANAKDRIRVLGYRIQVHDVGAGDEGVPLYVRGDQKTVISGPLFIGPTGLGYVQDGLNVQLLAGESVEIASRTTGTISWALITEAKG